MKIIDREYSLFGREVHLRIVPKQFRSDLSKVGTLLFRAKVLDAEVLLDTMRDTFCSDDIDDADMFYYREQVNDLKRELNI